MKKKIHHTRIIKRRDNEQWNRK